MEIKKIIDLKKKQNTLQLKVDTLQSQLELERAKKELWMEKVIEQQQEEIKALKELIYDRPSKRNTNGNETKRAQRGRPKKVLDDKGATNRVCDKIQQPNK